MSSHNEKVETSRELFKRKDYRNDCLKKYYYYDIECLRNFFCVVFKNADEINVFYISEEHSDQKELCEFLLTNVLYLKGYNNLDYDSQLINYILLQKRILLPTDIYEFSQKVIDSEFPIYREHELLIYNVDIYKILHLNNKNRMTSLKWCEFMLDWHNLEDMPHHHTKRINESEQLETIEYCINDVAATEYVFSKHNKDLELRKQLTNKFNINFTNKSLSSIGSDLLLDLYCKQSNKDKRIVKKEKTYRSIIHLKDLIFDYISFESEQLNKLLNYFKKQSIIYKKEKDKEKSPISIEYKYKGFTFVYGLGGIHGSVENKIVDTSGGKYLIIDADVASLYPSIAVVNKLYPEHLSQLFSEIYDKNIVAVRLAEKAKGRDGDQAIVAGYKEAANSAYGKSNEESSWLYDPKYTYTTTVNGQLMLTMLAEKLMNIPDSTLIQINTDGLTLKIPIEYETLYYEICKNWEKITQLTLEYAYYDKMMVRDVNNYIALYTNGKYKCKGAFEIENIPLHKNKSELIIRKAIFNWFIHDKSIEETILNHDNVLDFCIGVRAKQNSYFVSLDKNGKESNLSKTIRYYISTKGEIIKKRFGDGRVEFLNVHPQKGRSFKQTLLNKFDEKLLKESLNNIDFSYYLYNTRKEIEKFNTKPTLF